ncbi:MAG: HAD hydrolase family protein [Planctomycetes bacterium]|nr:HAD hydrolase family protein [Planctomycetota bacterium]
MPETDFSAIELLVLDVDGVLTDGTIVLTPAGEEIKAFSVRDGAGLDYWKDCGGRLAIITGRSSPVVLRRAEELKIDCVRVGVGDKFSAMREVLAELDCPAGAAAAIGDDLPDLPMLRMAGFSAAPADAAPEVRAAVDYVAAAAGGAGCVREVVELILKRTGKWNEILRRYQPAREQRR